METIFADGFFFERPREKAPDFVKGSLSIKVHEASQFMQKHKNRAGYINLDLLVSTKGKLYLKLNQYEPKREDNKVELENVEDYQF